MPNQYFGLTSISYIVPNTIAKDYFWSQPYN